MKKQDRDRAIWMLRKAGVEYGELAETFGLSEGYVGDVCRMMRDYEQRMERRKEGAGSGRGSAERELLLAITDYVLETYQPTRAEKAEKVRELMEKVGG